MIANCGRIALGVAEVGGLLFYGIHRIRDAVRGKAHAPTPTEELVELPIEQARRIKHAEGMAVRGRRPDEAFQGDPWLELYSELLDALNYAEEARKRLPLWDAELRLTSVYIDRRLESAASDVKRLIQRGGRRDAV